MAKVSIINTENGIFVWQESAKKIIPLKSIVGYYEEAAMEMGVELFSDDKTEE